MILNRGVEISQHSVMETEYARVTELHTTGTPVHARRRTGKGTAEHGCMRFGGFHDSEHLDCGVLACDIP
jgi:hypothetical protein